MGMKCLTTLLAACFLFAGVGTSHAVVRIEQDRDGGLKPTSIDIGTYVARARWLSSMVFVPRPAPSFSAQYLMTKYA